jgi:hypothetical protein
VEALDGLLARRQDLVPVLDDLVGGQPPARTPEVHRTAARMEPEPDTPRCLHLDLQEIPRAAGEDVVVVGRGGAAGEGEGSAPGAGGGVLGLLVDEVAGEVFGAAGIQGGDGAVLDGEAREVHAQSILAAARRTASRIFS